MVVLEVEGRPDQSGLKLTELDRSVVIRVQHVEKHTRASHWDHLVPCSLLEYQIELFLVDYSVIILICLLELIFDLWARVLIEPDSEVHQGDLFEDGRLAINGHSF